MEQSRSSLTVVPKVVTVDTLVKVEMTLIQEVRTRRDAWAWGVVSRLLSRTEASSSGTPDGPSSGSSRTAERRRRRRLRPVHAVAEPVSVEKHVKGTVLVTDVTMKTVMVLD